MAPIGPQIPQYLPVPSSGGAEDGNSHNPELPPLLLTETGPQVPHLLTSTSSTTSPQEAAGPQLPTHLVARPSQPAENDDEEAEEDAYAPALPPDLAPRNMPPPKRIIGPSLPTAQYEPDNLSEDEEVGPMPAPVGAHTDNADDAVREFMEREERRRKAGEDAGKFKKLEREEWMLVPPSSNSLLGSLDPTKLKPRQFSRSTNPVSHTRDNSLWTETPAERQARIKDEVEGKRKRATDLDSETDDARQGDRKRSRYDEQVKLQVEEYNRKNRAESLLDMHQGNKFSAKDDNGGPPAIWDHSRDMSVGGRLMDDSQRSKMIHDARGLGDRFGKGKSGSFL